MNAQDFLQEALDVMAERGKQYDKPDGERSMGKTVAAFNAMTGHALTEQDGWLLMETLKNVRQWQTPQKSHKDSLLDCVAYAALKAEAMMRHKDDKNTSSEWIPWFGDRPFECPDANVEIALRNGMETTGQASTFMWDHADHPSDIVKYRVILP